MPHRLLEIGSERKFLGTSDGQSGRRRHPARLGDLLGRHTPPALLFLILKDLASISKTKPSIYVVVKFMQQNSSLNIGNALLMHERQSISVVF